MADRVQEACYSMMQILTLKATTQGTFQVFFVSDCMIFPILIQYFVEGVG